MKLPLITLALGIAVVGCLQDNKVPPYEAAKHYLDSLKIPYNGVSCTEVDTDHDNYVTCTVTQPTVDPTQQKLMSIQCASIGGNAGGCKPTPDAKR